MRRIGGILPVDVDAVEAQVLKQRHGTVGEVLATLFGAGCGCETGRKRPASDGKQRLQIAILDFAQIQLLEVAE